MRSQRYQKSRQVTGAVPEGVLHVARPSIWGNPWIGPDAVDAYKLFMEQVSSGVLCIHFIESVLNVKRTFEKPLDDWKELRNEMFDYCREPRSVACWCSLEDRCHGQIILALPYLRAWDRAGDKP